MEYGKCSTWNQLLSSYNPFIYSGIHCWYVYILTLFYYIVLWIAYVQNFWYAEYLIPFQSHDNIQFCLDWIHSIVIHVLFGVFALFCYYFGETMTICIFPLFSFIFPKASTFIISMVILALRCTWVHVAGTLNIYVVSLIEGFGFNQKQKQKTEKNTV